MSGDDFTYASAIATRAEHELAGYACDATLFGRRVIVIPKDRRLL
jgi:hypothetical protein